MSAMKDYQKLHAMKRDLELMAVELGCAPTTPVQNGANMLLPEDTKDKFVVAQRSLVRKLDELRLSVDRLRAMPCFQSKRSSGRDVFAIRLHHENATHLQQQTKAFQQLQLLQTRDETDEKRKKKIGAEKLARHRESCRLAGEQLRQLVHDNTWPSAAVESQEACAIRDRIETRRADREAAQKQKRRRRSKSRDTERDVAIEIVEQPTENELAFLEQVESNRTKEDAILYDIERGLDDLLDLARTANQELAKQEEMLHQVDRNMDSVIVKFKSTNKRLRDVLERSGGCTRWCPLMILLIFVLALVGYFVSIVA